MTEDSNDDTTILQMYDDIKDDYLIQMQNIHEKCDYYTDLDKTRFKGGFSILHMNVRSMKNKVDEIQNCITRSDIQWDIICISETWLKDDIVKYYQMDNYNLFASCRPVGEGGGTAIYVHTKHEVEERKDLESVEFETNFVQIKINIKSEVRNILVGEIYRPPNYASTNFLSYMEKVLDTIEKEKRVAIIAGDFNYNLLSANQSKCNNDFSNLMISYGFFPMISKATRKQRQTEALLDNIFVNNPSLYLISGIFVEDLSDHLPIFYH